MNLRTYLVFARSACTAAGAVAADAAAQATDHRTAVEAHAGSLGKRDTDSPAPDADSRIASVNSDAPLPGGIADMLESLLPLRLSLLAPLLARLLRGVIFPLQNLIRYSLVCLTFTIISLHLLVSPLFLRAIK